MLAQHHVVGNGGRMDCNRGPCCGHGKDWHSHDAGLDLRDVSRRHAGQHLSKYIRANACGLGCTCLCIVLVKYIDLVSLIGPGKEQPTHACFRLGAHLSHHRLGRRARETGGAAYCCMLLLLLLLRNRGVVLLPHGDAHSLALHHDHPTLLNMSVFWGFWHRAHSISPGDTGER